MGSAVTYSYVQRGSFHARGRLKASALEDMKRALELALTTVVGEQ